MRFYPESIPEFQYEPTAERFNIIHVDNQIGECVISLGEFDIGSIVFAFSGSFTTQITQYTLQISKGLHIHDPYFMGKLAHSCSPNSRCDMETHLIIATKKIKRGNPITIDYEATEDVLFWPFYCSCNKINCRKRIVGKKKQ